MAYSRRFIQCTIKDRRGDRHEFKMTSGSDFRGSTDNRGLVLASVRPLAYQLRLEGVVSPSGPLPSEIYSRVQNRRGFIRSAIVHLNNISVDRISAEKNHVTTLHDEIM